MYVKDVVGAFCRVGVPVLVLTATASAAASQDWKPQKPVEIVVPAAPGGGTDRTARTIQKILQDQGATSQPLVVVNKPGAGGAIGYTYVAQRTGDGHYLAITQPSLLTNKILEGSTIDHNSVTPIAQLANEYIGFAVAKNSSIRTPEELLSRVRADPQSLVFGVSSALGQPGHIALGLVMKAAAVDLKKLKVVVFASGGESRTALLGGHVDVITSTVANLVGPLEAGQINVLAVTAPRKMDGIFANVPTWTEKGVNAVIGNWRGVVGPAKMTQQQVAYWEGVFGKLVQSEAWKQDAERNASAIEYLDSKASTKLLQAEFESLQDLLSDLGLASK